MAKLESSMALAPECQDREYRHSSSTKLPTSEVSFSGNVLEHSFKGLKVLLSSTFEPSLIHYEEYYLRNTSTDFVAKVL